MTEERSGEVANAVTRHVRSQHDTTVPCHPLHPFPSIEPMFYTAAIPSDLWSACDLPSTSRAPPPCVCPSLLCGTGHQPSKFLVRTAMRTMKCATICGLPGCAGFATPSDTSLSTLPAPVACRSPLAPLPAPSVI